MKVGDLVRIRKTAIDQMSTTWFIWLAESKTPLLVTEVRSDTHCRVLKPDGTTFHTRTACLTKRMW